MIEKSPDIDSFIDPLGAMRQQSNWARNHWLKHWGTPEGDEALEVYIHMEKEIRNYLIQRNKAL
jgi:hypothetical protein